MISSRWKALQLIDPVVLTILLVYGLVATLLTAGTTFALRIAPTAVLGLATLAIILWWGRGRRFAGAEPVRLGEWKMLWILICAGLAVRLAWWLLVHPVSWSDHAVYFKSAAHLIHFGEYRVPEKEGTLIAYRPPGTAFLLALAMKIAGIVPEAALLLNSLCFAGTAWLVWKTIRPKVTRAAALGAVGLLAFWPSEAMEASLPQSESSSLLGVALLMFLVTRRHGRLAVWAIFTGLLTGLICLIRNSTLILIPLWMLIAIKEPRPLRQRLFVCAAIVIATFLPILPWTYRNAALLGVPVLVATNGGENLYSANNDTTGGSWDETSVRRVRAYLPDEIKMDRVATQMARQWIRSNPMGFTKLAVSKLRILMSGDGQGPYSTLERGRGYTGPWLRVATAIANGWWLVLWGLVLTAMRYRAAWKADPDVYPILALAAIPALLFLVFQSQPRYHMPMVPPLVLLAGYALAMKRKAA
jgi:4-amino-4-deoxy-L-arabinose transferase-like glycosyltransferase